MKRPDCTDACYAMPECAVCRRTKKPIGRDSPHNGYCDSDCKGYHQEPRAGHLWPEERAEAEVEDEA